MIAVAGVRLTPCMLEIYDACKAMAQAGWTQDGEWLVGPKDQPAPAAQAADHEAGMQQLQQLTVRRCATSAMLTILTTIPAGWCSFAQEYIVKIGS